MEKKVMANHSVLHDLKELKKAKKAGGGKIIPATEGEKEIAAAFESCQSLEECQQFYECFVKPRHGLEHLRAKDLFENSPWGRAWFLDDIIKHHEGYAKYVEKLLKEGDFLHLEDLTGLSDKKEIKKAVASMKDELKRMIRARDKEIKKLTQPK